MSLIIEIRPATIADAEQISALIGELGYAISPEQLRDKLAGMQPRDADHVFVATVGNRLLGCVSLHAMPLFHAEGNLGRITALVVNAAHRGQGIGRVLVESAHVWFKAANCARFEVTSGDHRLDAHRFYARHGYAHHGQRLVRESSTERAREA